MNAPLPFQLLSDLEPRSSPARIEQAGDDAITSMLTTKKAPGPKNIISPGKFFAPWRR